MKMDFGKWLSNEIAARNISQATLARASGITNAQISRLINGDRNPGQDALLGIARALNLRPETVFEKAGILPPTSTSSEELSPIKRQLLHIAQELPDEDVEVAIAMLEKMLEKKTGYHRQNPQAKPAK